VTCRQLSSVFFAAALTTLAPTLVNAIGIEFTPVVGHYTPINSQVADNDAPLLVRQDDATAFGARVSFWIVPRIAAEASFLTASSSITLFGGGTEQLHFDAVMTQFDARARIRLNDPAVAAGLDFIAGIGMSDINDGLSDVGEEIFESPSTFTFVLGVGGTVPVSDKIKLRFDIEDHIHDPNYEIDETAFGGPVKVDKKQQDIFFLAGIVIPLGN
jgi:hypothetical protein